MREGWCGGRRWAAEDGACISKVRGVLTMDMPCGLY